MIAAGVRFIGDIQHADGVSWQHFFCPDGTIAEIMGPEEAPAKRRVGLRVSRDRRKRGSAKG